MSMSARILIADEVMPVNKLVMRIGRNAENDIVISDDSVSTFHAEIRRLNEAFVLNDLGSSNGTWVNGQQINEASLNNEDEIFFGAVSATFLHVSEKAGRESHSPRADNPSKAWIVRGCVAALIALAVLLLVNNYDALSGFINPKPSLAQVFGHLDRAVDPLSRLTPIALFQDPQSQVGKFFYVIGRIKPWGKYMFYYADRVNNFYSYTISTGEDHTIQGYMTISEGKKLNAALMQYGESGVNGVFVMTVRSHHAQFGDSYRNGFWNYTVADLIACGPSLNAINATLAGSQNSPSTIGKSESIDRWHPESQAMLTLVAWGEVCNAAFKLKINSLSEAFNKEQNSEEYSVTKIIHQYAKDISMISRDGIDPELKVFLESFASEMESAVAMGFASEEKHDLMVVV
jgi:pSer/pThr/pTyr-binding forkhead associated (FHA) protein